MKPINSEEARSQTRTASGKGLPAPPSQPVSFLRQLSMEVLGIGLPALFIALFVNVFMAQAMVVQGPSMQPNLYYNQRVLVDKISYEALHGPRRGDVVVVEAPGEPTPLIKRVVALAGEMVEVREGQVFIGGVPLDEPWVTQWGGANYGPEIVPPLHVFVLGDNRGNSHDSRAVGPISIEHIVGKARLVYWPLEYAKLIR